MPLDVVSFQTEAQTGAPPLETKSRLALLGHAIAANKPTDIEFNRVYNYSDPAAVATDFGDGSDLHVAAQQARAQQASTFSVVLLERTETASEVLGDSASTADVSTGTVSDVPITGLGDAEVSISVDGTEMDPVTPATTAPPTTEDGSDPAEGEAVYNSDTGEVNTGTSTGGSGPGIEVTYPTLSYTQGLDALRAASVDVLALANERLDRSTIGDDDEISTWGDTYDVTIVKPYVRGTTLADSQGSDSISAEQDLAADVGAYTPSKFALPITNSSTDAIGAAYAGRLSVEDAWYDPYRKTMGLNTPPGRYDAGNVGAPEVPGTFEGGRDGAGMSNVLANEGGVFLSNSLTTAGSDSAYRYLDVGRSEAFIKARARDAIKRLFTDNTIRFNEDGQTQILGALNDDLQPFVGGDTPFVDITPRVPEPVELTPQTRLNRIWSNIELVIEFAPTVHRAGVTIVTRLANSGETTADAENA